jgi:hypothetical protein
LELIVEWYWLLVGACLSGLDMHQAIIQAT